MTHYIYKKDKFGNYYLAKKEEDEKEVKIKHKISESGSENNINITRKKVKVKLSEDERKRLALKKGKEKGYDVRIDEKGNIYTTEESRKRRAIKLKNKDIIREYNRDVRIIESNRNNYQKGMGLLNKYKNDYERIKSNPELRKMNKDFITSYENLQRNVKNYQPTDINKVKEYYEWKSRKGTEDINRKFETEKRFITARNIARDYDENRYKLLGTSLFTPTGYKTLTSGLKIAETEAKFVYGKATGNKKLVKSSINELEREKRELRGNIVKGLTESSIQASKDNLSLSKRMFLTTGRTGEDILSLTSFGLYKPKIKQKSVVMTTRNPLLETEKIFTTSYIGGRAFGTAGKLLGKSKYKTANRLFQVAGGLAGGYYIGKEARDIYKSYKKGDKEKALRKSLLFTTSLYGFGEGMKKPMKELKEYKQRQIKREISSLFRRPKDVVIEQNYYVRNKPQIKKYYEYVGKVESNKGIVGTGINKVETGRHQVNILEPKKVIQKVKGKGYKETSIFDLNKKVLSKQIIRGGRNKKLVRLRADINKNKFELESYDIDTKNNMLFNLKRYSGKIEGGEGNSLSPIFVSKIQEHKPKYIREKGVLLHKKGRGIIKLNKENKIKINYNKGKGTEQRSNSIIMIKNNKGLKSAVKSKEYLKIEETYSPLKMRIKNKKGVEITQKPEKISEKPYEYKSNKKSVYKSSKSMLKLKEKVKTQKSRVKEIVVKLQKPKLESVKIRLQKSMKYLNPKLTPKVRIRYAVLPITSFGNKVFIKNKINEIQKPRIEEIQRPKIREIQKPLEKSKIQELNEQREINEEFINEPQRTDININEPILPIEPIGITTTGLIKIPPIIPKLPKTFYFGKEKKGVNKFKTKESKYKPSLAGITLKITATKKPKLVTGLGIRPIIVKKKKVKKKVKKKKR